MQVRADFRKAFGNHQEYFTKNFPEIAKKIIKLAKTKKRLKTKTHRCIKNILKENKNFINPGEYYLLFLNQI